MSRCGIVKICQVRWHQPDLGRTIEGQSPLGCSLLDVSAILVGPNSWNPQQAIEPLSNSAQVMVLSRPLKYRC